MYNNYHNMNHYGWYQMQNTGNPNMNRAISMEEAMRIATARVLGQVVKVELDRERGGCMR